MEYSGGGDGGGGGRIQVLNVAEKPSVAKTVSKILSEQQGGRMNTRPLPINNHIFEFTYSIKGELCDMIFTSVNGHLKQLDFEHRVGGRDWNKWRSFDPVELFDAPVCKRVRAVQGNIGHIPDLEITLKGLARNCQRLILWLDHDTEGENIAYEVMDVCYQANQNLEVLRVNFSALTERELHNSVENLVSPNKCLADAVDARQEIDLRVGAAFTRFQTILLEDEFVIPNLGSKHVISYGTCQFPLLGFVVDRCWEIQSHEPKQFWTLECAHTKNNRTTTFKWMRGQSSDYLLATYIYDRCRKIPTATVKKVEQKETLKYPPCPLNTIGLEKRASLFFKMSSKRTMEVAEDLYLTGFISYPRTETDSFSVKEKENLRAFVKQQVKHRQWGFHAESLLKFEECMWRNPERGGHDDKAHPPIHPTKFSAGESTWSPDHHTLYEFIVRHFLACLSQPAKWAETTVEIEIGNELFSASGKLVLLKNYMEVYHFEEELDGDSAITTYKVGQQFIMTTIKPPDAGLTLPPPFLSEADLLNCMDEAHIGTDATMHLHIQTLIDRHYVIRNRNMCFYSTHLGEALIMGYDGMGSELWKPFNRAKLESEMKAVSLGHKTKAEILRTYLQEMKDCFLHKHKEKLVEAMSIFFKRKYHACDSVVRICPNCKINNMVLKKKPGEKIFIVGCLGFPQCNNVVWLPRSISQANLTTDVCTNCPSDTGPVFKIRFKFHRHEIPQYFDADHLGCIGGCDNTLRQLVEICGTVSCNVTSIPGRGQGNSTTAGSSNRWMVCVHCPDRGHSSEACISKKASQVHSGRK